MRFRADIGELDDALRTLSESAGFVNGAVGRSIDDPSFSVITMQFADVGAYRKALSRFEVKAHVVPFLSTTLDEISTYEVIAAYSCDGRQEFTSAYAEDSHRTQLGSAAQEYVPPLPGMGNRE